jgi:hypothetical protein
MNPKPILNLLTVLALLGLPFVHTGCATPPPQTSQDASGVWSGSMRQRHTLPSPLPWETDGSA